jgi:hypothetical protein
LHTTGINFGVITGTVEMFVFAFNDVTQGGDAPVGMTACAAIERRGVDFWGDMVEEYERANGIGVAVW